MENVSQDNHPASMKSDQEGLGDYTGFYKILEKRQRIICIGIKTFSLTFWLKLILIFTM